VQKCLGGVARVGSVVNGHGYDAIGIVECVGCAEDDLVQRGLIIRDRCGAGEREHARDRIIGRRADLGRQCAVD